MKALRLRSLAVLCLTTLPWAAGATDMRFEQGSLIIPMQRAYQDECGAVSAYGLVYRLLQNHITVYWGVSPTKSSHHRCKNSVFTSNGAKGATPTAAEVKAMDGCDMTVSSDTGYPVSLLDNANAITKVANIWNTYDTSSWAPNGTGEKSITVDGNDTYLRYMGGPFIVDAGQAAAARTLIQNNADFANFRSTTACYANSSSAAALGTAFHVNVHVANNAFVAPVARVMNEIPPPIALIKGNAVDVLRGYLKNAGLQSDTNQGTFEKHGLIFDVLDENVDLASSASYPYGKLNYAPDPSNPRKTYYQVMWAPHWEGDLKNHTPELTTDLANIARFADLGNSIFNECASIQTYEEGLSPYDNTYRFKFASNSPTRFFTGHLPLPATASPGTEPPVNPNNGVYTTQGELAAMNSKSGFAPSGQDCSDVATGDCYMYGNYSDLFTQKGDYKLVVASGLVESFKPRPGQNYEPGTSRMFYTRSRDVNTAGADGWDIFITRQKDNNRQKGKIIYLGGHSFDNSTAGSRLVLNTLLNLSFRPDAQETSRSEPVADVVYKRDASGKIMRDDNNTALYDKVNVLSGTFMNLDPQALFPERNNFTVTDEKAADWMFPYVQGRFRSISPEQIGTATQAYDKSADWEADSRLPVPGSRQVFTVLGNNQTGLVRIPFNMTQLTSGTCRDKPDTGSLTSVCDLEEALNLDRASAGLTPLDVDGDNKIDPTVKSTDRDTNTLWNQHFVQRVLGYCVSRDENKKKSNFQPTVSDCNNLEFGEVVAHLGGLDHASAAVVGYSSYIKPATSTTPQRPEVAYIGGLDGQLHAIYLRGVVAGRTTQPKPGEELWSFIPQGQLARLATNNARVDISPVVSDVYVDYDTVANAGTIAPAKRHTNTFGWRTLLVSGSGRLGGEMFALDVTDPINPIVLWDMSASSYKETTDLSTKTAILWRDSPTNGAPTYTTPKLFTDIYDYTTLGDSLNMNLVPVRRGNRPSFQVIVSTNGADDGNHQLNVFGIDAGSGAKIWEWRRMYSAASAVLSPTSNSVPGGTSTYDVDGDGNADRVYAGDMEGKLWELSILTGANLNYYTSEGSSAAGSYSLFDNATVNQSNTSIIPQPITTQPAIMRVPYDLTNATSFTGMKRAAAGRLAFVFGTGGADWVLATSPKARGRVYVTASHQEDSVVRAKTTFDALPVNATLKSVLGQGGTTQPDAVVFTQLDEKERIVGAPKIVGSTILITTAYGNVDTNILAELRGRTHLIDLSKSGTAGDTILNDSSGKSAAGVVVLPDGSVVTQSMTGISKTAPSTLILPKMGLPGKRTSVRIGSWLDTGNAFSE